MVNSFIKSNGSTSFKVVSDKYFDFEYDFSLLDEERKQEKTNLTDNFKGIVYMIFSVIFFSISNLISKYLTINYKGAGNDTINLFRGIVAISLMSLVMKIKNIDLIAQLKQDRNISMFFALRCFLAAISNVLIVTALQNMRISSAITISFLFPIFGGLLCIILLGHPYNNTDVIIFILSLFCVCLITKPSFLTGESSSEDSALGIICAFLSSIFTALSIVCQKKIGNTFQSFSISFTIGCFFLLFSLLLMVFDEFTLLNLNYTTFSLVTISAVLFVVSNNFFSLSIIYGEPIVVLPVSYMNIVLAYLFNVFVFKSSWDFLDILGGLGILSVNIYRLSMA